MTNVNVITHLDTLLQKEHTLSPAWKARLTYMIVEGYNVCFKNTQGLFCYRRDKVYHDATKDLQPV